MLLSGWANERINERMAGIGVLKGDHRLRMRGPPGWRKNLRLGKWELSLRRLRVGICRRVDFVIMLLSPSPNREHLKPLILISP